MTEDAASGARTTGASREGSEVVRREGQAVLELRNASWAQADLTFIRYRRLEATRVSVKPSGLAVSLAASPDPSTGRLSIGGAAPTVDAPSPAGKLHITPPGADFVGANRPTADPVSYFNVVFPMAMFAAEGAPPVEEVRPRLAFTDPALASVLSLALQAVKAGEADRLYTDSLANFMFAAVLRSAAAAPEPAARGGLGGWRERRVRDFMHSAFDQDLSIAMLAEVCGLSPFHFVRVFRESFGVSPHGYLRRLRIARAKTLLATTPMTVAQVAQAVGYDSSQALARMFRREGEAPPRAFKGGLRDAAES